jgi:chitinase
VNAGPTDYTDLIVSFFLPSTGKPTDFAATVLNPDPAYGAKAWVDSMHSAGKRVLISAGGATDTPTSASYFTSHEPVALAKTIADLIKAAGVDGVDLDWEDDWSNSNPGLTGYGPSNTRTVGGGPAVKWLVTLTQELRKHLPRPRYSITHAPQAPYFDIGYAEVYKGCGADIDWFNVQFYNQGPVYITKESLVDQTVMPINPKSPSANMTWDGSIADIVAHGIPAHKIVVGKPVQVNAV